jgi:hypothetical protein
MVVLAGLSLGIGMLGVGSGAAGIVILGLVAMVVVRVIKGIK